MTLLLQSKDRGFVHTNTFSFSLGFVLVKDVVLLRTAELFENNLQSGYILKLSFRFVVWTVKTDAFKNDDGFLVM